MRQQHKQNYISLFRFRDYIHVTHVTSMAVEYQQDRLLLVLGLNSSQKMFKPADEQLLIHPTCLSSQWQRPWWQPDGKSGVQSNTLKDLCRLDVESCR